MLVWSTQQLSAIVNADDLHVSPLREDGATFGTPTWVWCVQVGGALYARAYHGERSRWFRAAIKQELGRITAASRTWNVAFIPVAGSISEAIDVAYCDKYAGNPYLPSMTSARARAATVKIVLRQTNGL